MISPPKNRIQLVLAALLLAGCNIAPTHDSQEPYVLVLGTAQDGGLPQIGCSGENCRAARLDSSQRRLVSSLLLVDPATGSRWLFDATPDLPLQVDRAEGHPPQQHSDRGRSPLFDGIFLTHAHTGHYTGLIHLGNEAYGSRGQTVYCTPQMSAFLTVNDPWKFMVEGGFLSIHTITPGTTIRVAKNLDVTAIQVPHRDELSDTVAYRIDGPGNSVLFLPDVDKWDQMDTRIEDLIASVDIALIDGTFFAEGEIPGRAMSEIPHPFIQESLHRFAQLPLAERRKIVFTHLNHSNPAAATDGQENLRIQQEGMRTAREGEVFSLGKE